MTQLVDTANSAQRMLIVEDRRRADMSGLVDPAAESPCVPCGVDLRRHA